MIKRKRQFVRLFRLAFLAIVTAIAWAEYHLFCMWRFGCPKPMNLVKYALEVEAESKYMATLTTKEQCAYLQKKIERQCAEWGFPVVRMDSNDKTSEPG